MFEFIKRVFKREEPKRIPGVTYAEVDRVPIKRIGVKEFEPLQVRPKLFEPQWFEYRSSKYEEAKTTETTMIWRYQYTDTGEIVEKPNTDAIIEILGSNRPVEVLEHFIK